MNTSPPAWLTQDDPAPLTRRLAQAIQAGHLWPAFQPVVCLHGQGLSSFEVLSRWHDPQDGELSPVDFIPALDRHGLLTALFDAQVQQACLAANGWPGRFSLAFNISPSQLTDPDMPQHLAQLVAGTGFALQRVQIEVTEGALQQSVAHVSAVLEGFNAFGVRIAIDDFGTGYSSLARLGDFPFHKLKIDARFVNGLSSSPRMRRIVAAIINLAQSLDMIVCAEGVETDAAHDVLRDLGCDLGQGWLYSKAVSADEAGRIAMALGDTVQRDSSLDNSLFQQHHQLETLYRTAPFGMAFLNTEFRHVRANDRYGAIYHTTGKALEGKSIDQIMSPSALKKIEHMLRRARDTDSPVTEDDVCASADNRIHCMRVKDVAGDIIGFSLLLTATRRTDLTRPDKTKAASRLPADLT